LACGQFLFQRRVFALVGTDDCMAISQVIFQFVDPVLLQPQFPFQEIGVDAAVATAECEQE
jgi:hypothetical protein